MNPPKMARGLSTEVKLIKDKNGKPIHVYKQVWFPKNPLRGKLHIPSDQVKVMKVG